MNNLNNYPLVSINKIASILRTNPKELIKIADGAGRYYKPFDIRRKGSSKWRHIDNPVGELKIVQQKIYHNLLAPAIKNLPEGMVGGVSGKSIIDNARPHTNQKIVARIDLKDCFPKISNKKIYHVWVETFGCGRDSACILTQLTSFQTRLPQGATTSSALCNLVLLPLFTSIEKRARQNNYQVSQYIDDITISGEIDVIKAEINQIIQLIQKYGFAVRRRKIKLMPANSKQETTGLVLNKKISVPISYYQNVRFNIHHASKHINHTSKQSINEIIGKIHYICQIDAVKGERLLYLANALLSNVGFDDKRRIQENEIRKCNCTRIHRQSFKLNKKR